MKIFITFIIVSVFALETNADERLFKKIQRKIDRNPEKGLAYAQKLKGQRSKEPDAYYFLAAHYYNLHEGATSDRKARLYLNRAISSGKKLVKYSVDADYLSKQKMVIIEVIGEKVKNQWNGLVDQGLYEEAERLRHNYSKLTGIILPSQEEIEDYKEKERQKLILFRKKPRYVDGSYYGLPSGSERITAYNASHEKEILSILNKARIAKGLNPVVWSTDLNNSARYHAYDMAKQNYFSHSTHDSLDGELYKVGGAFERIGKFYHSKGRPNGENIAAGSEMPKDTYTQWFNSPGHHDLMFKPSVTKIGVGLYYNPNSIYKYYWVMCTASG